ncbi:MAG: DUF2828 family protein [Firmicutes bacterium]|nr:DUF2828 family protein [Bacillota bacterium]
MIKFADIFGQESMQSKIEIDGHEEYALQNMYENIAQMREKSDDELFKMFEAAHAEDPLGALRCLFYVRDIRGGKGERDIFRTILRYAAQHYPEEIRVNIPCIPFYGRYDDLYFLIDTPVEEDMWGFVKVQFQCDIEAMEAGVPISLLAKWLKKANSSSLTTKRLGIYTAKKLGYTIYDYKRICSKLRKYLDVLEVQMSAGKWKKIQYEQIPYQTLRMYQKTFDRHDSIRFHKYLQEGKSNKKSVAPVPQDPIEIVRMMGRHRQQDQELQLLWDNLPNYIENDDDFLVMADLNLFRACRSAAIALALYFAEHNRGVFHNVFMTFSHVPEFVTLQGSSLREKVDFIGGIDYGYVITDPLRAMEKVLDLAVKNQCSQEELPKAMVIVTGLDFDRACGGYLGEDIIKARFAEKGYEAPGIIFWNVNAEKEKQSHFKNLIHVLNGKPIMSPVDFMYEVLNGQRYEMVQLGQ